MKFGIGPFYNQMLERIDDILGHQGSFKRVIKYRLKQDLKRIIPEKIYLRCKKIWKKMRKSQNYNSVRVKGEE